MQELPFTKHSGVGKRFLGKKFFLSVYLANLFISLSYFVTAYVNSSFLSEHVPASSVGLLYAASSILSLLFLFFSSEILREVKNRDLFLLLSGLALVSTLGLALSSTPEKIFPLFVLLQSAPYLIAYCLDIFLEGGVVEENTTGRVKGGYLTVTNVALVLSPVLAGFIILHFGTSGIYATAALFIFPLFLIGIFGFQNFKDPVYEQARVFGKLKLTFSDKNLRDTLLSNLLLQIFYTIMVIYLPLLLLQDLSLPWEKVSILLSIMLLPFLLFEFPAGALADKVLGEKEIMIAGFLIMGLSTFAIAFFNLETSLFLLAGVLFTTRVGASLVEITTESYFFKKTNGTEAEKIGLFRMTHPISYFLGPVIGTATFLFFGSIFSVFIALSLLMIPGIFLASTIEDTK